jgi:hypothetical protein
MTDTLAMHVHTTLLLQAYSTKLPLRVANNPTKSSTVVALQGIGVHPHILYEPQIAVLGPILPSETEHCTTVVTMKNDSDIPVEVYSVDFDKQHLHEEEVLLSATGYSSTDDMLRVPVRTPGAGLHSSIAPATVTTVDGTSGGASEGVTAAADADDCLWLTDSIPTAQRSTSGIKAAAAAAAVAAASWDKQPSVRDAGKAYDVIVSGPVLSGKTTAAYALAQQHGLTVLALDTLVEQAVCLRSQLGRKLRAALHRFTPTEHTQWAAAVTSMTAAVEAEQAAAAVAAAAAAAAAAKAAKKGGKAAANAVVAPPTTTEIGPVETEYNKLVTQQGVSSELLLELLQWRLSLADCERGVVIDSAQCSAVSATVDVATVLRSAMPTAVVLCIDYSTGESGYAQHVAGLKSSALHTLQALPQAVTTAAVSTEVADTTTTSGVSEAVADQTDATVDTAQTTTDTAVLATADAAAAAAVAVAAAQTVSAWHAVDHTHSADATGDHLTPDRTAATSAVTRWHELDDETVWSLDDKQRADYAVGKTARQQLLGDRAARLLQRIDDIWDDNNNCLRAVQGSNASADNSGTVNCFTQYETAVAQRLTAVFAAVSSTVADDTTGATTSDTIETSADAAVAASDTPAADAVADTTADTTVAADQQQQLKLLYIVELPVASASADTQLLSGNESTVQSCASLLLATLPAPLVPAVSEHELPLLPDRVRQLIKRPVPRTTPAAAPPANFKIVSVASSSSTDNTTLAANAASDVTQHRWVIAAHSSAQFAVRFSSAVTGVYECSLQFEVVGTRRRITLPTVGTCAVPTINSNPTNVFMRRVKHHPAEPIAGTLPLSKRYIMSRAVYEFGPLLCWKKPVERLQVQELEHLDASARAGLSKEALAVREAAEAKAKQLQEANSEMFRISNAGKFPAHVSFSWRDKGQRDSDRAAAAAAEAAAAAPPVSGKAEKVSAAAAAAAAAAAQAAAAAAALADPDIFFVHPVQLELKEGETREIRVWAFPPTERSYSDALVCTVQSNPAPVVFAVSCSGAAASARVDGPWSAVLDKERSELAALPPLSDAELQAEAAAVREAAAAKAAASKKPAAGKDKAAAAAVPALAVQYEPGSTQAKRAELTARIAVLEARGSVLDFDRLLLTRSDRRQFTVVNTSTVPVKWRVTCSALAERADFAITVDTPAVAAVSTAAVTSGAVVTDLAATTGSTTSAASATTVAPSYHTGRLDVGASVTVTVAFTALQEAVVNETITVTYCDELTSLDEPATAAATATSTTSTTAAAVAAAVNATSSSGVVSTVLVGVLAESYEIKAVAFEQPIVQQHSAKQQQQQSTLASTTATASGTNKATTTVPAATVAKRPAAKGVLDYGRVRVGDAKTETFILVNSGKYDITYTTRVRRGAVAALVKVAPASGTIAPGSTVTVGVTLCAVTALQLRDNFDLRCTVAEPHTGEAIEEFSVGISATAVWSQVRVQPSRGLNFGPTAHSAGVQTKHFELKNEGDFEFAFALCQPGAEIVSSTATAAGGSVTSSRGDAPTASTRGSVSAAVQLSSAQATNAALLGLLQATPKALLSAADADTLAVYEAAAAAALRPPSAAASKGKPAAAAAPNSKAALAAATAAAAAAPAVGVLQADGMLSGSLTIGQFTVAPYGGTVQPGQSVAVVVHFQPAGRQTFSEIIEVRVSGEAAVGSVLPASTTTSTVIPWPLYELMGESCVPGIETRDWRSIFEEQAVVAALHSDSTDGSDSNGRPGTAGTYGGSSIGTAAATGTAAAAACFVEDQRLLSFGTVTTVAGHSGHNGACERVKIMNHNKVPCTVQFKIGAPAVDAATAAAAAAAAAAPAVPLTAKEKAAAAKAAAADSSVLSAAQQAELDNISVFSVQPSQWDIPPHEYRYVSVYFKPTEMRAYKAKFAATVLQNAGTSSSDSGSASSSAIAVTTAVDSSDDTTTTSSSGNQLEFLLGGKGTMPTVALEAPLQRDESGAVALDFGDVANGHSKRLPIVLRNSGSIAVTCLFEFESSRSGTAPVAALTTAGGASAPRQRTTTGTAAAANSQFLFAHSGSSVTLAPGEKREFEVVYQPRSSTTATTTTAATSATAAASAADVLQMTVMHNPFGATAFALTGACVSHDVAFEDIPAPGCDDEIVFEQIDLIGNDSTAAAAQQQQQQQREVSFWLRNQSKSAVRFSFAGHAHFQFSPAVGHIPTGAVKEVHAVFTPSAPVAYTAEPVAFTTQRITYTTTSTANSATSSDAVCDWDDAQQTLRPATDADLALLSKQEAATNDPKAAKKATASTAKPAAAAKGKGGKDAAVIIVAPLVAGSVKRGPVSSEGVQMVYAVDAEPEFTSDSSTEGTRMRTLKCTAVADVARYELQLGTTSANSSDEQQQQQRVVTFRPTAMYQSCVHSFTVRNPALTALAFDWSLYNLRSGSSSTAVAATSSNTTTDRPSSQQQRQQQQQQQQLPCPYSIEPVCGSIAAGTEQSFLLRFSPLEVDDYAYRLVAAVPALRGDTPPLTVTLRGRATRPLVHFDLQPSTDYLAKRSTHALPNERGVLGAPIECTSAVRVCEVTSRGTRVRNPVKFSVVNPTNASYDFVWEVLGEPSTAWKCMTERGAVLAGKRGEMLFEFTPAAGDESSVCEAFMRFTIAQHGVSELFLFAGHVAEPLISLDRARVDCGTLMVGAVRRELFHIVNHEPLPYSFSFDKAALLLQGAGGASTSTTTAAASDTTATTSGAATVSRPVLEISPMSALLPAYGRVPIEITFCPQEERQHNFNLSCTVRKKPAKLNLNIKGEGFAVHARLMLEGATSNTTSDTSTATATAAGTAAGAMSSKSSKHSTAVAKQKGITAAAGATTAIGDISSSSSGAAAAELLPLPAVNAVDFGTVYIHERAQRKVTLVNPGKFNVDYAWSYKHSSSQRRNSSSGISSTPLPAALTLTTTSRGNPSDNTGNTATAVNGTAITSTTVTTAGSDSALRGTIKRGERVDILLEFAPQSEALLDGGELLCTLAMSAKHTYALRLSGRGAKPGLHFNFLTYDFGPCFVTAPGQVPIPERALLRVTNRDTSAALSLNCEFEKSRCLWLEFDSLVVAAGAAVDIPLCFAPREAREYAFSLPFVVNGSYTVKVAVLGEGCPARLELANAAQRHVQFGIVPAGAAVTKSVKLVNRSRRSITLSLSQEQQLGKTCLTECSAVTYTPQGSVVLAPKAALTVELTFAPTARLAAFSESLLVTAGASSEPRVLCCVSGQSTGMSVKLGQTAMPFGIVCLGSAKVQRLQLENTGMSCLYSKCITIIQY